MNCQRNVNSTLPTQLPHQFSYIVPILGYNHFESPSRSANKRQTTVTINQILTQNWFLLQNLTFVFVFSVTENRPTALLPV
jgi:hypothetical protein